MTCHFHPDDPAVADIQIALDDVPVCVPCAADAIEEDRFAVDFYTDIPHDDGEGAVIRLVHERDLEGAA